MARDHRTYLRRAERAKLWRNQLHGNAARTMAESFKTKTLAQLGRRDYWEWYVGELADLIQEVANDAANEGWEAGMSDRENPAVKKALADGTL